MGRAEALSGDTELPLQFLLETNGLSLRTRTKQNVADSCRELRGLAVMMGGGGRHPLLKAREEAGGMCPACGRGRGH